MPQIVIENLFNKTLKFALNFPNVLKAVQSENIDWMHACGGKGRCITCRMAVLEGMEFFTYPSPAEMNYKARGLLYEDERLACQVKVTGDVRVKIPKDCKFPHIEYSD